MSEQLPNQQFNVHLFAVVRHKVSAIGAATHREAVEIALAQTDLTEVFRHSNGGYADELAHFLVDVVGDDEFAHSHWFHSRDNPLLPLLEQFIHWHEAGETAEDGSPILAMARQSLADSL